MRGRRAALIGSDLAVVQVHQKESHRTCSDTSFASFRSEEFAALRRQIWSGLHRHLTASHAAALNRYT